jgi:hypothetical protein
MPPIRICNASERWKIAGSTEGKSQRMRRIHYIWSGLAVAVVLAVSIALLLRDFPAGPRLAERDKAGLQTPAPAPPPPPEPEMKPDTEQNTERGSLPGEIFNLKALPSPGYAGSDWPPLTPPMPALPPKTPAGARLNPTTEQTERLRYVLLSHTIMQSEAPEFPLRIGGMVPPNVTLVPMPREIADIIPDYARYSYVLTQYQIVIVVTERREIDLLIPIPAG